MYGCSVRLCHLWLLPPASSALGEGPDLTEDEPRARLVDRSRRSCILVACTCLLLLLSSSDRTHLIPPHPTLPSSASQTGFVSPPQSRISIPPTRTAKWRRPQTQLPTASLRPLRQKRPPRLRALRASCWLERRAGFSVWLISVVTVSCAPGNTYCSTLTRLL